MSVWSPVTASMEGGEGEGGDGFLLQKILLAHPDKFGHILQNASKYRFQVLLSQVEQQNGASSGGSQRRTMRTRRLVRHGYRVDAEYFYPASAIKLAAVVAAVEKLERLRLLEEQGFDLASPLTFFPLLEGSEEETRDDPTNLNGQKITLLHEIRKLFLVSDNEAFNRLYAVVGHRTLNQIMWDMGLRSARLHHRLSVTLPPSLNRCCEPVKVHVDGVPYVLAPKKSGLQVPNNSAVPGVFVGQGYVSEDGDLIGEPMDFSMKNYMSLTDLQNLLVKLVRPDVELGTPALQIGADVRLVLLEAMSQYPASSHNPSYDAAEYPDDYCKFFLPGVARVRSKGAIRIYNKIGRAYGFTVDNAYILDIETGRSFFLSAVIYTNSNEILNDDKYEYEDVADKVMADLGEVVAAALWKGPPTTTNNSSLLDQTPSSLWNILSRPIVPDGIHPLKTNQSSFKQTLPTSGNHEQLQEVNNNSKDELLYNRDAEVKSPDQRSSIRRTASGKHLNEKSIRRCYRYFVDE